MLDLILFISSSPNMLIYPGCVFFLSSHVFFAWGKKEVVGCFKLCSLVYLVLEVCIVMCMQKNDTFFICRFELQSTSVFITENHTLMVLESIVYHELCAHLHENTLTLF